LLGTEKEAVKLLLKDLLETIKTTKIHEIVACSTAPFPPRSYSTGLDII
jgi:hypothetical protein